MNELEIINSGDDYADVLINKIRNIEASLPENQQQPIELMKHWEDIIREMANDNYTNYIIGKREHYLFDEEEMLTTFRKASELYVNDLLGGLVDKGLVEAGIDENGDVVFSLSDNGKEWVNKDMNKNKDADK